MRLQTLYIIGLITTICGALLGQAEMIGEPWHHYLSIISIAGVAASGFLINPPRDNDRRDRKDDI